tara:strand:- start:40 stop:249 length:210 start_codon:yes stop_codon:yes gene_type:complete
MIAKDKAKELVERFKYRTIRGTEFETMSISLAKQCALICVDEILEIKSVYHSIELDNYWQEVKQEIENI